MLDKEKAYNGRIAIGSAIRSAREREGLSCLELGSRIGVTRQTIFKIEQGKWNAGTDHLVSIASALGYEWALCKNPLANVKEL